MRLLQLARISANGLSNSISLQHHNIYKSRGLLSKPRFWLSSARDEDQIKQILSQIPIEVNNQKKTLMESGLIKSYKVDQASNLSIQLNTVRNFPKIKATLIKLFNSKGYSSVEVTLGQNEEKKVFDRKGNLAQVKKLIAVSSCKGGVGKSTVAVNIAYELQQLGHSVGILDADIYGPSLPTLANLEGRTLTPSKLNPNNLVPIEANGVKCMSFGFVASQPAAMRGPMASSIVSQLALQTEWGALDYLIVDMPPGTGDVNLSLCEQIQFDGAVIVTTPQRLSFVDVLKGIQVFQDLRVRILGVVENMSYYSCPKCGVVDEVFGPGHNKMIMDQLGIQNAFKIPLISEVSKFSDSGSPAVLALPRDHLVKQMYTLICASIKSELVKPKMKGGVFYSTTQRLVIAEEENNTKKIDPVVLRSLCKCSECVNEATGQRIPSIYPLDPQVYPVRVEEKGNYAVGIVWSDGHKNSIYSFKRLFSNEIPEVATKK